MSSRWAHGSPVLCLSAGTVPGCKLPVPGWGQAPSQLHSSWLQAVEQLNIKAKNFRDLLTDEPFSRQDIITLQVCVPSPCCSQEGPPESLGSAPLGQPHLSTQPRGLSPCHLSGCGAPAVTDSAPASCLLPPSTGSHGPLHTLLPQPGPRISPFAACPCCVRAPPLCPSSHLGI